LRHFDVAAAMLTVIATTGDDMNATQIEQEPPTFRDKLCIGLALEGKDIRVAARAGGREIAHGSFPASPLGTTALLSYLADCQTPMRLAVATAGVAALALALAVGAPTGREVFLVSAQMASAAPDLARYAERAI
jgi:hypothetical protein